MTAATTFTIDAAACTANVCTSSQVGTHIVSGQWRGVTATASLSVRPDAPSKLTAVANGKKVNLSWAGGSTDKTYRVYRSSGGGSMVMIASGLTATSFSDSTVVSGVTYSYYVTGVSAMGVESLPSNTVSVALN